MVATQGSRPLLNIGGVPAGFHPGFGNLDVEGNPLGPASLGHPRLQNDPPQRKSKGKREGRTSTSRRKASSTSSSQSDVSSSEERRPRRRRSGSGGQALTKSTSKKVKSPKTKKKREGKHKVVRRNRRRNLVVVMDLVGGRQCRCVRLRRGTGGVWPTPHHRDHHQITIAMMTARSGRCGLLWRQPKLVKIFGKASRQEPLHCHVSSHLVSSVSR